MTFSVFKSPEERQAYEQRAFAMKRLVVAGGTGLEGSVHYMARLADATPGEPYHCGTAGCAVCEDAAVQLKAQEAAADRQPGEEG